MEKSNFSTDYRFYELYSSLESAAAPFEYIVQYINEHPGVRCFIFADQYTKDDIDTWLNDERVKVYWWEDMTKTHATSPEAIGFDVDDDLIKFVEALNGALKPDFGAIIEVYLPATSEELLSLYYPTDSHPAGEIVITNGDDLSGQVVQQFRATFGNDLDGEDVRPFVRSLYGGWAIFSYEVNSRMRLDSDFRLECVTIPSYSDVDISTIDWGTLEDSYHTTF